MLCRSFFSGTIRLSRRYSASSGAGTPWRLILARAAVEARHQQGQLVRVRHRESQAARRGKPCQASLPDSAQYCGIAGQLVGRHVFPGHAGRVRAGAWRPMRHEGVEEPAPRRVSLLRLVLAAHVAQLLAQLDPQPDRIVPQHLPRTALHHVRAHVQRGEDRVERRRAGVQQHAFVESPVLDPAPLPLDMPVPHMDLRRLREAGELLMGRLGGNDSGVLRGQRHQAHGEAAAEQRGGTS